MRVGFCFVAVATVGIPATVGATPPSASFPPPGVPVPPVGPPDGPAPVPEGPPAAAPVQAPPPPAPVAMPPQGAAPPPSAPPATHPPARARQPEGTAFVRLWVSRPDAWLDLRSVTDDSGWVRACRAPCDTLLYVDGREARVRAPGMTTSNAFTIQPGEGVAKIRVAAGSADDLTIGRTLLVAGVPTTLGGAALFGLGAVNDSDGMRVIGIASLVVGTASVIVALPFLASGATVVRDKKRNAIARALTDGIAF